MQTYDQIANKDKLIETKLDILLSLTATDTGGGQTRGSLRNGNNSNFIMTFPNNENGKDTAVKFLEKLENGKFINADELNKIKSTIGQPSNALPSLFLDVKANDDAIQIVFNYKGHYRTAPMGLDNAIQSAINDFKEEERLERMWAKPSSLPADITRNYLENKFKKALSPQLTKREFKTSHSATGEKGEYTFTATVNHNQKVDHENIDKLIVELNKIFGDNKKVRKITNDDDKIIGFSITENPAFLVGYIKINDRENLPKPEDPISHER